MAEFLRHASRHVHHTIASFVEDNLGVLGWTSTNVSERPFGAEQLTIKRVSSPQNELAAGLVTITLGDEVDPDSLEMGGPLSQQDFPIFVDIYMDQDATALAVACDVRDLLLGRFDFARPFLPVIDQATALEVVGWRITFDDVERARPDNQPGSLHWQVVKVTAVVEFPEARY